MAWRRCRDLRLPELKFEIAGVLDANAIVSRLAGFIRRSNSKPQTGDRDPSPTVQQSQLTETSLSGAI